MVTFSKDKQPGRKYQKHHVMLLLILLCVNLVLVYFGSPAEGRHLRNAYLAFEKTGIQKPLGLLNI